MQQISVILTILLLCLSAPLRAQNNAEEQSAVNAVDLTPCRHLMQTVVLSYQELARFLPKTFKPISTVATHRLIALRPEDCQKNATMRVIERSIKLHTGKIGILLPLSQWPIALRQAVTEQINELVQSLGADPAQTLIWLDTAGPQSRVEAQLAQLVFMNHIGVLVGGLVQAEAQILGRWADRLQIPALILNRRMDKFKSKQVFYLGPDPRLLASSLSRHMLSRGLRRIAIIMPQSSRDGPLVDSFISQAQHLRLTVAGPYLYNPNDFTTIDAVLRKIFHIDDPSRNDEQLDLVRRLKDKAQNEGMPFDSRNVVLPAAIDIDALVIVDHFKNVRHLAKALAYYGVKRLPLLGVPKWRAFELVDGNEEILNGAVFVDYIGSYKKLPYGISGTPLGSEYFVPSSEVDGIDLKLLVSHAVYAAFQAVATPRLSRPSLFRRLEAAKPPSSEFFAVPTLFRPDHIAYWPSFLFSVGDGTIQQMQMWNPVLSNSR